MSRFPISSQEVAELEEQRAAMEDERQQRQRDHDARCSGGWLGEDPDGRPVPCVMCRPWTTDHPCEVRGTGPARCTQLVHRGRRCCDDCAHTRGGV